MKLNGLRMLFWTKADHQLVGKLYALQYRKELEQAQQEHEQFVSELQQRQEQREARQRARQLHNTTPGMGWFAEGGNK